MNPVGMLAPFSNLMSWSICHSDQTNFGNIALEIGNMKKLRTINLDSNNFTGAIPTTFSKLSLLVTVDLSNNQIFGNLTELCLKAQDLKKITSDCLSPDIILCSCCTFCS